MHAALTPVFSSPSDEACLGMLISVAESIGSTGRQTARQRVRTMGDYSKVSPAVWQSRCFNSLPSDDGSISISTRLPTSIRQAPGATGCPMAMLADLRWPVERYRKALAQLVAADMVRFDEAVQIIDIVRWVQAQSDCLGIERQLEGLSSEGIANKAPIARGESARGERLALEKRIFRRQCS
jgi:hypothetical protein